MCVCICMYTYIYICVCIYIYIYIYIFQRLPVQAFYASFGPGMRAARVQNLWNSASKVGLGFRVVGLGFRV